MDKSVYSTPKSDLDVHQPVSVPEEISKKIKNGWIAACVSGTLTLVITLLSFVGDAFSEIVDVWTFIDVVLIFALACGIYKKSRFAATCMFVYFLASKIWMVYATGSASGIYLGLVFLYFYFMAMLGTFQYHSYLKEQNEISLKQKELAEKDSNLSEEKPQESF